MKIVAISGSLRKESSNSRLVQAALSLAPSKITVLWFNGLDRLPYFNSDLDTEAVPPEVKSFREILHSADGFLISSPEYIHGIPGVLKNALDWTASSGGFENRPVVLLNSSASEGQYVDTQLTETLGVLMAKMVFTAPLQSGQIRQAFAKDGTLVDTGVKEILERAFQALLAHQK